MGQGGQRKPLRFESWKLGNTGPSKEIQTHPNPTPWRVQGSSYPCTSSLPSTLGHSDAEGQAPAGVAGRRGKATCPHDVSPQVASATESSLKTPSLCWGLCDSSQAPLGAPFPHLHNGVMWFCQGSAIQLPCPGLVTCYIFSTARPGGRCPPSLPAPPHCRACGAGRGVWDPATARGQGAGRHQRRPFTLLLFRSKHLPVFKQLQSIISCHHSGASPLWFQNHSDCFI